MADIRGLQLALFICTVVLLFRWPLGGPPGVLITDCLI
jgi:hypothetical protein